MLVPSQNNMSLDAKPGKSVAGRQEWVTTIECVSAAGRALFPLFIHKGSGLVNRNWFSDNADLSWDAEVLPAGAITPWLLNGYSRFF